LISLIALSRLEGPTPAFKSHTATSGPANVRVS
jgi:hypothetical protein